MPALSATYASPVHEPFVVASVLGETDADKTEKAETTEKTTSLSKNAHLAALRAAVTCVQADVNRELTARMALDARSAADAAAEKEEATYGEETMEE